MERERESEADKDEQTYASVLPAQILSFSQPSTTLRTECQEPTPDVTM